MRGLEMFRGVYEGLEMFMKGLERVYEGFINVYGG